MNKRMLAIWATPLAAGAFFFWGSACFAISDSAITASSAPLQPTELWPAIVSVFNSPDGRIDFKAVASTLHAALTSIVDKGQTVSSWGAAGPNYKLSILIERPEQPNWSITMHWQDNIYGLFQYGRPPRGLCITRDQIKDTLIGAGWKQNSEFSVYNYPPKWKEYLGYSSDRYPYYAGRDQLPPTATFIKNKAEVTVSLEPLQACFDFLSAHQIP